MKNTVLKYGMFGFLTAFILFFMALYFGKGLSFKTQEVLGYATMITSLIFVYFGIKHYKDYELNGEIDFKTAFIVGALISIFAALGFGLMDAIYVAYINPDFMNEYTAYEIGLLEARTDLTPEELNFEKLSVQKQSEAFGSPLVMFFVMTMTVLVIGVIISILSALVLQRKTTN
jgi:ABC-type sugar transport system permease subunit